LSALKSQIKACTLFFTIISYLTKGHHIIELSGGAMTINGISEKLPPCPILALVATVQAEEAEGGDTRQDNHANTDQQRACYSFTNLVTEFSVHGAYLHPLEIGLSQLCKH
jgi:hypothetical protein